ncbi:flagellar export protein FliJ [Caldithrix abyssi]|nr:flagellar export protein FliJ [Caldithrix abyssi]
MMGNFFQFPLQKVLDLRKTLEETQATILSKVKIGLMQEEEKLTQMKQEKESALAKNGHHNKDRTLTQLKIATNYIVQLGEQVDDQHKKVQVSSQAVEEEREKLLGATRDKKVLENLRERKKHSFRLKIKKEEIKKIDESASRIKYQRQDEQS